MLRTALLRSEEKIELQKQQYDEILRKIQETEKNYKMLQNQKSEPSISNKDKKDLKDFHEEKKLIEVIHNLFIT